MEKIEQTDKPIKNKYLAFQIGIIPSSILLVITFFARLNLIYIEQIGQISVFLGLLPITALVIIDLINNKLAKKTIHIILFPVALFTFIYIFSKLQWSVECCPENYESMVDWNANKGISYLINIPLTFMGIAPYCFIIEFSNNFKKVKNVL